MWISAQRRMKGITPLAEIFNGGGGRLSRFDFAVLAGQLYRRKDGNSISIWNVRD